MVLVFISSALCPLVMSTGQIFCVRSAHVRVHALCLWERETFLPVGERKGPSVTKNKVMSEVTPVRSSVLGSLCWLLVKQASSLIWHLYRGYALFICPFFIFLSSSSLKCRNTSWMCMEKWETYGLYQKLTALPAEGKCWFYTNDCSHIQHANTDITLHVHNR